MNNTLEQLLADPFFILWVKGECSAEQKKYWNSWLLEKPEYQALVREAKEIIVAVDSDYDTPDSQRELEKLDWQIDQYERCQRQKQLIFTFSSDYQLYRTIGRWATAAAIVIAVMLGGMMGYYANEAGQTTEQEIVETPRIEEYRTDYGEKLMFRLNDGSRIMLNGNSRLTFSSTGEQGLNTEVWLEGEAYFNIVRLEDEQQRIFTVQTDDGAIQVLGTRFAVNTFRDETTTVLEEGKVTISNRGSTADYELAPGQLARFKFNDNKVTVKEVSTPVYTSWTEDKLIFIETPMKEVANRIEDMFGVEVMLAAYVADESLSGSIKSTNLQVVKEALEEILKTAIVQEDNQLFIGID